MGTRVEQRKECDKGACRKRMKVVDGEKIPVKGIEITIRTWLLGADAPVVSAEAGPVEGSTERTYTGELCPDHVDLAHRQAAGLFINTKTY